MQNQCDADVCAAQTEWQAAKRRWTRRNRAERDTSCNVMAAVLRIGWKTYINEQTVFAEDKIKKNANSFLWSPNMHFSHVSLGAEFNGNDDILFPWNNCYSYREFHQKLDRSKCIPYQIGLPTEFHEFAYFPFLCWNVIRFLLHMNYWRFDRFYYSATQSVYIRNIRLPRNIER